MLIHTGDKLYICENTTIHTGDELYTLQQPSHDSQILNAVFSNVQNYMRVRLFRSNPRINTDIQCLTSIHMIFCYQYPRQDLTIFQQHPTIECVVIQNYFKTEKFCSAYHNLYFLFKCFMTELRF